MPRPRSVPATRRRSAGGFLLGVFVGVLLGLAVSLGIAFYLNRTPIPFITAKPKQPEKDTTQAKPPANSANASPPSTPGVERPSPPVPHIFQLIQEQSQSDWEEMYKVFNMGIRLEVYVPEAAAQKVIDIAAKFGIDAWVIGRCEKAEEPGVAVKTGNGEFWYPKDGFMMHDS